MSEKKWSGLKGNKNAVGNRGNKQATGAPKRSDDVKLSKCIWIRVTEKEKEYFDEKIKKLGKKPRQIILNFLKEN